MFKPVVAALLALTTAAHSAVEYSAERQDLQARINPYKVSLGAQLGLVIANATVNPPSASGNRIGMLAGAYLEAPVVPGVLYFQPELNYVQKGAENSQFGAFATAKMGYLEIPLLAKIKFNVPRVKPVVFAGPSMAYLLAASVDGSDISLDRSAFNNLDFALNVGAGFSFQLGQPLDSSEVTFTAKYSAGLNNVAANGSWRSNTFGIQLGFQL